GSCVNCAAASHEARRSGEVRDKPKCTMGARWFPAKIDKLNQRDAGWRLTLDKCRLEYWEVGYVSLGLLDMHGGFLMDSCSSLSDKPIPIHERLILALDVDTAEDAKRLVEQLGESVTFYKLGLQLFMSGSYHEVVRWLTEHGK